MKSFRILHAIFFSFVIICFTSSAFSAENDVRIGAIYPLSGPTAATGKDIRQAVELAAEIINGEFDLNLPFAKSRGLPNLGGQKIYIIFADHQGNPEKAKSEAERLIVKEKVVAMQGAHHSSCVATASQVGERLHVPFVTCQASSPTLHQRGLKWFFRVAPHDGIFAKNFFAVMKQVQETKGQKIKKIGIVWENTLYGRDAAATDKQLAREQDYDVVVDIPYAEKSAELTSEVQKVKSNLPDVVFHASYVSDAILFLRTYKELDVNVGMLFGHGGGFLNAAFVKELGKDAEYVSVWETWSLDLARKKPLLAKINELFYSRYGRNMNAQSATAFTTTFVIADAINRAKSADPEKVRDALRATDMPAEQIIMPWEKVAFDPETGQNMYAIGIVCQILGGKYNIVWPAELAVREIVWPIPKWNGRP
jgi:branched-chain amino acid transport system substrate-binding protein